MNNLPRPPVLLLLALPILSVPARRPPCPTAVGVSVTPDASPVSRPEQTNGHTQTFTVTNTGTCNDTYSFTKTATGPISGVTLNKSSASLAPGNQTTVIATYNVGTPGNGVLTLTATGQTIGSNGTASDNGSFNISVIAVPLPLVNMAPHNYETQQMGRCAANCFAATYAQSTVPYFSLDRPRAVTLVYHGDRVDPQPFLHVDVRHGGGGSDLPAAYRFRIKKADQTFVRFLSVDSTTLRFVPSIDTLRLGGQLNATANGVGATGVYPITVVVGGEYVTGVAEVLTATKLTVVNETNSPIARGWTVAGVQRLYAQGDGAALITEGEGSAVYFAKSGSVWTTPAGEFSQLVAGTVYGSTGWTRRYADSTRVLFDSTGRMIEARDAFNNITTVTYDGQGRIWQLKDPLNLAITLSYDANGLTSIQDPGGRVTDIVVNANRVLTTITDPDMISTTLGYDASLRLSTITNRRGHTTTFFYDGQSGKIDSVRAPAVEVVNADGSTMTASPTAGFRPWHEQGVPYGSTASTPAPAPRADTVYARLIDPGQHITRFTVNRWGSPAVSTDPLARTDSTRFDGNGLPIRTRSHLGTVDSAVYNGNGLPTYVKPTGPAPATRIQYLPWARPDTVWAEDGSYGARYFIGANGRVDSIVVAAGTSDKVVTKYTYEPRGRVATVTDGAGHGRSTSYAGTNGNQSLSAAGGRSVAYGYDAFGRVTTVSPSGLATGTTYYSIINRPDSVRDGVNPVVTRYGYDALFLTSVTDPKGQAYGFTRNALGWLTQRTDPAAASDLYKYSREGELRRWTNRRGQTIEYAYEALHRPTSKSGANTATETWTYPSDTVVVATSPAATDTMVANRIGQLVHVSTLMAGQHYERRYTYTSAGVLDSVIPSGGGITFQSRRYIWNLRRGLLSEIKLSQGPASTAMQYAADGLPQSTTFPGGDQVTRSYTATHANAGITTSAPYSATVNRSSGLDAANRISRHILNDTLGRQYSYDSLGRLRADSTIVSEGVACDPHNPPENGDPCVFNPSWTATGGVSFSYDSAGNRRDLGGTYTTGNRITSFNGCTYTTDADGNVSSRTCPGLNETMLFTWTADNRLASLTRNGQQTTFEYNTAGRLVKTTSAGGTKHFLWESDNILAELDGSGTGKVAEYSYYPGLDNPHALIVGATTYYTHRDGLGNVIALTDEAKALQRWYRYDAWGNDQGGTDLAGFAGKDRSRFKGALRFDLDLYYMRNRWYEPQSGRFLSEDPIGLSGGVNQYIYAADDPINRADPTGLKVMCMVRDWFLNGQFFRRDVLYCWDDGEGKGEGGGQAQDPIRYDKCRVATILADYIRAMSEQPGLFAAAFRGERAYPADFDFKYRPAARYQVGDQWLRDDEFGNFAAGYVSYRVFGQFGKLAARVGGIAIALDGSEEPWHDLESAPMINAGAARARNEGYYPITPYQWKFGGPHPPPVTSLTSTAGCGSN